MQSISTYTDWDIVEKSNFNPSDPSIWYIEEGEDYPRLYYEYQSPKVSTLSASDIQSTSAVLNGNLTDTDGEDSISVYFQYKRKSSQEWRSTEPTLKDSVGLFGTKISKLLPNKEYEYRAVIKWRNVGIVYGDIFRFTTPPIEYEEVETTVNEIEDYTNTETELIITNEEEGSIEFPPGLNLEDNIEEFLDLEEYLVVEYVPVRNIFRARVHSTGLSYLATQPAIIKFMNVSKRLGVSSLTSNNFREYMRITVFDDRGREVNNTSSYYDWNLATYNSQTDILRLPVNHFSEYVLGAIDQEEEKEDELPKEDDKSEEAEAKLPETGMNILPFMVLSVLFCITVVIVKEQRRKRVG